MPQLITIPTAEPDVPPVEDVRVGVAVQAATVRAFLEGAAHLMGLRLKREAHNVVAHDISGGPLEEQTPKGATGTVRTLWRVSRRAEHVWCWIRYQAARGADDRDQVITAALHAFDDGAELDKGVAWTADHLDGDADEGEDAVDFPLRETHTGFDTVAGFESQTPPRLLNIPDGLDGDLVELRVTATDARIIAVSLWELAPATMEQS